MVTYQYVCEADLSFDVRLPMGTAPPSVDCPVCGQRTRRVFATPRVSTVDRTRMNLIDSTKETSERPDVVTSIPSAGRRRSQPMAPPDPRLQKLPRP
jgi:putative FmdB family regulatory protein